MILFAPVYLAGDALMSLSSTPMAFGSFPFYPASHGGWATIGWWAAVFVIGIGSGFIKPSVSVFACDQLKDKQGNDARPEVLTVLYLYWYMAINIGSLIGQFVAPALQGGPDGVPNLLTGFPNKYECGKDLNELVCGDFCPGGCTETIPTEIQLKTCCTGPVVGTNFWLAWGAVAFGMCAIAFAIFYVRRCHCRMQPRARTALPRPARCPTAATCAS